MERTKKLVDLAAKKVPIKVDPEKVLEIKERELKKRPIVLKKGLINHRGAHLRISSNATDLVYVTICLIRNQFEPNPRS